MDRNKKTHTGGGLCINSMNFSPPHTRMDRIEHFSIRSMRVGGGWGEEEKFMLLIQRPPPLRNVGYIADFWKNLSKWDPTLERKAGGVFPQADADLGYASFAISNASSVMALVRAVVGNVMRTNSVPEPLATYFTSVKIMWLFSAQVLMSCNVMQCHAMSCHVASR